MSDPGTSYRTHADVQEIRKTQDPISNFKEMLIAQSLATEQECKVLELVYSILTMLLHFILKDIEDKAKQVVEAAVEVAKTSKEIEVAELTVDIYADSKEPVRNVLPNQELLHSNQAKAINV